jgi:hypothetical protein
LKHLDRLLPLISRHRIVPRDAPLETEHSIMTDATSLANNLERVISRIIDARMVSERTSQRAFFGVSALLFAASAAVTIVWCASMAAMCEMPMCGGSTMSIAWESRLNCHTLE